MATEKFKINSVAANSVRYNCELCIKIQQRYILSFHIVSLELLPITLFIGLLSYIYLNCIYIYVK